MLKISYNTNGLRNLGVIEALKSVKEYGYDGVEMSFHENHIHPLRVNKRELKEIKDTCLEEKINIVCIASGADSLLSNEPYEPSLIHPDEEGRLKRIDLLKRSIEIANYLNVPVLNFASGKLKDNISDEQAVEWLCRSIESLLKESGELILTIEPEPGFFIGTTDRSVDLIRKVNHPGFRLNLDIGHVYCCEDNFYQAIENSLEYTRHIHIEDIKNKVHHHEIPGEGDIDFKRVLEIIKKSGYDHYISVELYHHAPVWQKALKESKAYLSDSISSIYQP